MFYFISNSKWLTQEMINSLNISNNDKVILFNKAENLHLFQDRKDLIFIQRWSGNVFHGEHLYNNAQFKNIYLYGRGKNSSNYIKKLKKYDYTRTVTVIKHFDDVGKECFGEERFSPFLGTSILMYFDYHYPKDEKVLVGFTSYNEEKKLFIQKNSDAKMHDNYIDRKVMLDYCSNKPHIIFRYSHVEKEKLFDIDPKKNYKPTKQYELVNIEKK